MNEEYHGDKSENVQNFHEYIGDALIDMSIKEDDVDHGLEKCNLIIAHKGNKIRAGLDSNNSDSRHASTRVNFNLQYICP